MVAMNLLIKMSACASNVRSKHSAWILLNGVLMYNPCLVPPRTLLFTRVYWPLTIVLWVLICLTVASKSYY